MNIKDILYQALDEYGLRNNLAPEQGLRLLNEAQSRCFSANIQAFKEYGPKAVFASVAQDASGDWYIPFPTTNPPIREVIGLTSSTRDVIYGTGSIRYQEDFRTRSTDVPGYTYAEVDIDNIKRRAYFGQTQPTAAQVEALRWVYYRDANYITSYTDTPNLEIPAAWHWRLLVLGVTVLGEIALDGQSDHAREWESNMAEWHQSLIGTRDTHRHARRSVGLP